MALPSPEGKSRVTFALGAGRSPAVCAIDSGPSPAHKAKTTGARHRLIVKPFPLNSPPTLRLVGRHYDHIIVQYNAKPYDPATRNWRSSFRCQARCVPGGTPPPGRGDPVRP